jgi:hypothetical protein
MLPEAEREWSLIRFQDFKSVAAYNSAVHKVNSKLRFCNKQVSDENLIEKTLCTFHPSMRILQQQYRQHKYMKYSELIYTLLQAKKHDELLMKNHNARPTGAMPIPKAHANAHFTNKLDHYSALCCARPLARYNYSLYRIYSHQYRCMKHEKLNLHKPIG